MEGPEHLRNIAAFGGLDDAELEFIAGMLREERFEGGECAFTEGDLGSKMYVIRDGKVEILKSTDQRPGAGYKLASLLPGDCLGEMSLIDIQPRSATARAVMPTVCFTLSNRDMNQIRRRSLRSFSIIVMNLGREISRRLRAANELVANLGVRLPEPWKPQPYLRSPRTSDR